MTSISSPNKIQKYQIYKCAVKNCKNNGTIEVKIRFLNKSGRFCDSCIDELKKQDLIENG